MQNGSSSPDHNHAQLLGVVELTKEEKEAAGTDHEQQPAVVEWVRHKVEVPPEKPLWKTFKAGLKEGFFPEDPLRQFRGQSPWRRLHLALAHFFPILEWLPRYRFTYLRSDFISGLTIASLAIPQGISYAKLARLPPLLGLYSSFVPPLVYTALGSSRDVAVGTVAIGSMLLGSLLGSEVSGADNPTLFLQLAFTSTFFAGLFEALLGLFRLGFVVDFLSHATIIGFMGGASTVVCFQQLKGIFGLQHFTDSTSIVSVMRSLFTQAGRWKWQPVVMGCAFLFLLLLARYLSKKQPRLFWVSAAAPLACVIVGSLTVYFTNAHQHGVHVVGDLKKGLNPSSIKYLTFESRYLIVALKVGIITALVTLAEGIAVGRSFAFHKNYNIDGNKEMIAFGMMNIVGSCTSCYITTGAFSRSAVNFNAGCKTAMSNLVMAIAVMITLKFLTPLFHYTPLVVLSSIIISATLGLINYEAAFRLWQVDKFDFCVCMGAYLGVVFLSVDVGLLIAVGMSMFRVLLFAARPRTHLLGNIPNSDVYRNVAQYPSATTSQGVLVLHIGAPIYFTNANYLRERVCRWIDEEEDKFANQNERTSLQHVILDMSAVSSIDTSGISMLHEMKKIIDGKGVQLALANPTSEVMKKLGKAKFIESLGADWIFLTVGEAVRYCNFVLRTLATPEFDVQLTYAKNINDNIV